MQSFLIYSSRKLTSGSNIVGEIVIFVTNIKCSSIVGNCNVFIFPILNNFNLRNFDSNDIGFKLTVEIPNIRKYARFVRRDK